MKLIEHNSSRCSISHHRQPLIPAAAVTKRSEPITAGMHLHLRVPACTVSIFQCGLIERTIPFAHLERADSLVKPSLILFGVDQGAL